MYLYYLSKSKHSIKIYKIFDYVQLLFLFCLGWCAEEFENVSYFCFIYF